MQNTKEVILQEALKLFSCKGYDAVSVRDIANKINMTQAALYKHYSNKQDIFDCIIKKMEEEQRKKYEELKVPQGDMNQMAKEYKNIDLKMIKFISEEIFKYWTGNQYAKYFRKMITIEQYKNEKMSKLYHKHLAGGVIDYLSKLFEEMIKVGVFKENDPYQLALEFYSPIYMLISIYDVSENKEDVVNKLINHIDDFSSKNEEMIK